MRVSLPRPRLQDPGRRCEGQSRQIRLPGQQSRRGTRLTLGPLAEPEEASGWLRAESQIEPWFASRERDACIRPVGSRVEREVKDAEEDCPAYPEAPEDLVLKKVGADCQGKERPTISGDEVCP